MGYTSAVINFPSVTSHVNDEFDYSEYNYNELYSMTNDFNIGRVKFNKTSRKWQQDRELMVKPLLHKTVKYVYDNLINHPIQGLHGAPSEKLPATTSSKLINCQGITCLSSDNVKWHDYAGEVNGEDWTCNNKLVYNGVFTNIPIIDDDGITTNEFFLSDGRNIYNVPIINSFFGIKSYINIYDIKDLYDNVSNKYLFWKTRIHDDGSVTDIYYKNSITLYNYDIGKTIKLADGFMFDNMEQHIESSNEVFTLNPYGIYKPSSDFSGVNIPAGGIISSYIAVSIGTTPRYPIITLPADNNIPNNISGGYIYNSCIYIANGTGRNELLSSTYQKINYYCDRLNAVIHNAWHTSSNNKPYSYKDLSNMVSNNTSVDNLAKAILQYTDGNVYVKEGSGLVADNIITGTLGTLNRYNWLKWEDITVNTTNLFNAVAVDYTATVNYDKPWISNKYNITNLNI